MSVRIQTNSRLQFAPLLEVGGYEFWDPVYPPDMPTQPDDVIYTVKDSDRIDLLAYRFYGDPSLWWVIAVVNNLEILPTDLVVGANLRIPSKTYVTTTVLGQPLQVF
jgi:hypothetical protein